MRIVSQLEQAKGLDRFVAIGQRVARKLPPGKVRDGLNGVWLGHPLHPLLVQAPLGAWLSAAVLDGWQGVDAWRGADGRPAAEQAARRLTAFGVFAVVPAALAGAADWSEQHEQQMRVGVVHLLAVTAAATLLRLARGRRPESRPGAAVRGARRGRGRRPAGRAYLVPAGRRGEPRRGGAAPGRARLA